MAFAHVCILPRFQHYQKQFLAENGRCFPLHKFSIACKIFDPFVLKETCVAALDLVVDNLARFKYDAFTPSFLSGLKEELPKAKEHANKVFNWGILEGCARYERRNNNRNNRCKRSVARGDYGDTSMNACNRRNPTRHMILTDVDKLIMMIGRKTLGIVYA